VHSGVTMNDENVAFPAEETIGGDHVVEDAVVDEPDAGVTPPPPPTPTPGVDHAPLGGMSSTQLLLMAQGALVLLVVIVIIVMVLCRGKKKKKEEKKLEDTDYPSVEQVCEEQTQTRSQLTLRKPHGVTEETSDC